MIDSFQIFAIYGENISRMDQVKCVEHIFFKNWINMVSSFF